MSTSIRTRHRAVLAASAVLAATATAAGTAVAATTGPTAPDELFNGYQHCSTDASAPVYLSSFGNVSLEGVPQDAAAAAGTEFGAQYLLWPVSSPTQTTTYSSNLLTPAGFEAPVNIPSTALTDGTTYAWQARTVVAGTTVSKWSKTCYFAIDNDQPTPLPTVTSANYPAGQWSPGGVPAQFTFAANGATDVAGYEYVWDTGVLPAYGVSIGAYGIPEPKSIWADTKYYAKATTLGGEATLNLIPPSTWGPHTLTVASLDRADNRSGTVTYQVFIRSTAPTVTPSVPNPQFDTPTTFTLAPNPTAEAASPVVSYSVSIGGGTPRTVKADANGAATVTLRLKNINGSNGIAVTSTSANGWVSDPYQQNYYFDTTPVVNSNDYPEYETSGGAGIAGTFTFTAQVPNIVSYTYSLDGGATETTVKADKSGNAQITWTPPTAAGNFDMTVYGTTKDGLKLLPTDYYFSDN